MRRLSMKSAFDGLCDCSRDKFLLSGRWEMGTARTGTGQCGSIWTTTIALTAGWVIEVKRSASVSNQDAPQYEYFNVAFANAEKATGKMPRSLSVSQD